MVKYRNDLVYPAGRGSSAAPLLAVGDPFGGPLAGLFAGGALAPGNKQIFQPNPAYLNSIHFK